MSRLADRLMGMDRGAARPAGLGGIPRLTERSRGWRPAAVLVIVVGIVVISGTTFMLRPRSAALPVPRVPAPAMPAPPPRPAPREDRFTALLRQGLGAAEAGKLQEAARLLGRALELKPRDAETWNRLGVVLVRLGETSRGIDALIRAVRLRPTYAEGHRNLAVALDRQGRSREAEIHYRAFLRLSGEDDASHEDVRRRLADLSSTRTTEEPR
jgi:hypothetical protein